MKTFETLKSENFDISKVSEDIKKVLNPLSQNPFLNGQLLEDVTLSASSTNSIEHKLGRKLRFWSIVRGPVVSSSYSIQDVPLTSYTPTVTAFSGAATNYSLSASYSITDAWMTVEIKLTFFAASGAFTAPVFSIPSGYAINTTNMIGANGLSWIGSGGAEDSGVANYPAMVIAGSTTTVVPMVLNAAATYTTPSHIQNNLPFTFGANDTITFNARFPLVGKSINPKIWEVSSDLPEKFLNLKSTTDCTVSLYVG